MIAILLALSLSGGCILVSSSVFGHRDLVARVHPVAATIPWWQAEFETLRSWFLRKLERSSRHKRALYELPDILDMLSVALSAGDSIFAALVRVSAGSSGVLATEFQRLFIGLELGSDIETELKGLASRLPQRQVSEFANKLSMALRRGSPLAEMISEQSESARAELRNELLGQAGRNETRMLIPLVFLILPVTVLFAIYPSLELLNISYK
jgi:tight adherence protein C